MVSLRGTPSCCLITSDVESLAAPLQSILRNCVLTSRCSHFFNRLSVLPVTAIAVKPLPAASNIRMDRYDSSSMDQSIASSLTLRALHWLSLNSNSWHASLLFRHYALHVRPLRCRICTRWAFGCGASSPPRTRPSEREAKGGTRVPPSSPGRSSLRGITFQPTYSTYSEKPCAQSGGHKDTMI